MLRYWAFTIFCISFPAWASKPSYHVANPIGWMHDLPVGETPGWSGSAWLNLEINHANIWNREFELTDDRTGKTLAYGADYEQTSVIADLGFSIGERLSFGLSAPFAARGGGVFDDFIDQFHVFIGGQRFLRNHGRDFSKQFTAKSDGVDQFGDTNWTAIGNLKLKTKLWLWKWQGSKSGSCDCGFSFGGQVKLPLARGDSGMSSGGTDYTLTAHLGAPLGKHSGIWATAAATSLGRNQLLRDWPRRRFAQMYELSMDLGGATWGLLLQARTESPIMNKSDLTYKYPTQDLSDQLVYRLASGWNGLVYWRGTQTIGLRWRSQKGSQINLLLMEDWALGSQDGRYDHLYVTNAPDVAFVTQVHLNF